LLTVRIRLVICSVDRALELGIRWWETDGAFSADAAKLRQENTALLERVTRLEQALAVPAIGARL
jgi:hypothetical protein